ASDGFDGTWVAHPDIVDPAREEFDAVLGDRPNQIDRLREDVAVEAGDLLDVAATPGAITEAGLRNDVSVGFQYISFWLGGRGAAAINNLMEDASRAARRSRASSSARSSRTRWRASTRTSATRCGRPGGPTTRARSSSASRW